MKVFPDFPKKGIQFIDIMPLFLDPVAVETLITHLLNHVFTVVLPQSSHPRVDVVVGLDARGFLFGPLLAARLNCAFVPVRKAGKLPGPVHSASYVKEYGTDSFEIQQGAIKKGATVLIVDDLIATGGSAAAAGELVHLSGGNVLAYLFLVELTFLKGSEKLKGLPVYSIIKEDD